MLKGGKVIIQLKEIAEMISYYYKKYLEIRTNKEDPRKNRIRNKHNDQLYNELFTERKQINKKNIAPGKDIIHPQMIKKNYYENNEVPI